MAVIVRYVVERNGVEKMTFTSKKEADAYDKLLDIAEALEEMLENCPVELAAEQREELALYLANQKDPLQQVLKGGKPKLAKAAKGESSDDADTDEQAPAKAPAKRKARASNDEPGAASAA